MICFIFKQSETKRNELNGIALLEKVFNTKIKSLEDDLNEFSKLMSGIFVKKNLLNCK